MGGRAGWREVRFRLSSTLAPLHCGITGRITINLALAASIPPLPSSSLPIPPSPLSTPTLLARGKGGAGGILLHTVIARCRCRCRCRCRARGTATPSSGGAVHDVEHRIRTLDDVDACRKGKDWGKERMKG